MNYNEKLTVLNAEHSKSITKVKEYEESLAECHKTAKDYFYQINEVRRLMNNDRKKPNLKNP
jgi:hypothetical protein